jgi:hypothetical protein
MKFRNMLAFYGDSHLPKAQSVGWSLDVTIYYCIVSYFVIACYFR